ncbi:hypothetical protein [Streptosporangium vulgare]|uniref:hypothetical protein n=1 Tax=Streptosporangium vulgare TaxID=46190 RepID=UPI0031DDF8DB
MEERLPHPRQQGYGACLPLLRQQVDAISTDATILAASPPIPRQCSARRSPLRGEVRHRPELDDRETREK